MTTPVICPYSNARVAADIGFVGLQIPVSETSASLSLKTRRKNMLFHRHNHSWFAILYVLPYVQAVNMK